MSKSPFSKSFEKFGMNLVHYSVDHPQKTIRAVVIASFVCLVLAVVPSIKPDWTPFLNGLKIDTDPENMLPASEPARVFHNQMKKELALHDMVVVGIVNQKNEGGVYNPQTLKKIYDLAEFAKSLDGVITIDLMAPSTVDQIEAQELGSLKFDWLMKSPPEDMKSASRIKKRALRIPMLNDTVAAQNGKAIAIYIPIKSKDLSYRIYNEISNFTHPLQKDDDEFYIAGLPVAEDVFGVEMFKQMAVAAPLAMLIIFLLMFYFFRNITLIASPLMIAMVAVIWTMSLLIASGQTVHIMSSMIPIFIMPISVLDAIHLLSEFFDKYQAKSENEALTRKETVVEIARELYRPLLFTTLTTMAGFASLALTPIPPVKVFGVFVAIGVFFAWLLTMTFIPAYIMRIDVEKLKDFGLLSKKKNAEDDSLSGNHSRNGSALAIFLQKLGSFSYRNSKTILFVSLLIISGSIFGVSQININDNPTKWFEPSHPIRVADRVMNENFGGTYMAYLTFSPDFSLPPGQKSSDNSEIFKSPEVLIYLEKLQKELNELPNVGKSNSLMDIVKTVHRDLFLGDYDKYLIPESQAAIGQVLLTFQNGHRPHDLWHFVTPDYRKTSLWLQLRNGDNQKMEEVVDFVDQYLTDNPPPEKIGHRWFGLTYINKIWQDKMVSGMLEAFLGSFAVVLLMMSLLFRSLLWGILSMIPLSFTILLIYGFIGFIGKDYDMPVAVLSSLSLGLAIDYAIHFLARARESMKKTDSWEKSTPLLFAEPARAIFRNIIVVGMGFLPLLLSPLVPYQTVGFFIAAILFSAGAATLILLPGLIKVMEPLLKK